MSKRMCVWLAQLWSGLRGDLGGATALEYGLIAVLIAIVLVGGLTIIGTSLSSMFNEVATSY